MTGGLKEHDFVAVTEAAAVAAAQTMGYGDRRHSDHVAVEAMREALAGMAIDGRVVIGEGERDKAPMLYVGEQVGRGASGDLPVDFAVDPLEGTNLCATGASDAMAVLAASERGGLLHAPDIYMDKIVVGPTARGRVDLDARVEDNLDAIAGAFGCAVSALTVVVLDRDRHRGLIEDIRRAGARIKLIGDGDLSTAIAAAVRGTGVHAVIGTGGAPEGVITAAAMRCLGGEIQGRLSALSDEQERRLDEFDIEDRDAVYTTEQLAPGDDILFCCTGVTGGDLLRGVRFEGNGYRTSTLVMSLAEGAIRFVETIHRADEQGPVYFHHDGR
ncbi:MAG: class II fructose-bisphosphatase [Acidobacteria bacterium]|nr:class II fructose-bisphosphatase [Acidobacteriota bacterium]